MKTLISVFATLFPLLLGSSPALADSETQTGAFGYDYQFGIDWLKINFQRSKNGDNDWMVYQVRVMRGDNQVFYAERTGQLTQDKPLTSIQSGDFIGLTDQQHRWPNPFIIDTQLQSSDVVIGTFTIVNQSHENHDPDAQRKKWSKFVDTEDKSATLSKLIALPTGTGPLVGTIADIYVGLLKAVGVVWDLVSPPLGHDVNCDGPVLSGYWKFAGSDLLQLTNNSRLTHAFSIQDTSSDKPASECGHPPDTEAGISIVRSENAVGSFGSGGSSSKTNHSPVTKGPAGAWYGEWVEHIHVKDSQYDVSIEPSPFRLGKRDYGGAPAQSTYQVTVRELAAPGSSQVVFETSVRGVPAATAQLPALSISSEGSLEQTQVSGKKIKDPKTPVRRLTSGPAQSTALRASVEEVREPLQLGGKIVQGSADAIQLSNGVYLYLYAVYSNNRLLNYAIRYVRTGAADVILQPAQKPLG